MKLLDWELARLANGEAAQKDRRAEGKSIHVLATSRPDLACAGKRSTLRLGLARCLNVPGVHMAPECSRDHQTSMYGTPIKLSRRFASSVCCCVTRTDRREKRSSVAASP